MGEGAEQKQLGAEQLGRELVRAQRSLLFLQREHETVLAGLHQEIQQLTSQCSGNRHHLAF